MARLHDGRSNVTGSGRTGGRLVAPPGGCRCRPGSLPVKQPSPVSIAPLAPERYRIQLTVSRETHDRFRRAQALLRHAVPSGDAAEIFDRAITLLVDELERKRFAETVRPRATTQAPPEARATFRRRCGATSGGVTVVLRVRGSEGRCGEPAFLEFHHVEPYAVGGAATVENVELRCRAHNAYEARLFFGPDVVREGEASWGELVPKQAAQSCGFEFSPD